MRTEILFCLFPIIFIMEDNLIFCNNEQCTVVDVVNMCAASCMCLLFYSLLHLYGEAAST